MNIDVAGIWTAAGVLMGFQVTSFAWRISREVEVGDSGDLTWLPLTDMLNLVSMTLTAIGVFTLPILGLANLGFAKTSFGLAILLFLGYPFALAGHYEMYDKETARSYSYLPRQEKIVVAVVAVLAVAYVAIAIL